MIPHSSGISWHCVRLGCVTIYMLLCLVSPARAQQAEISGTVVDSLSGVPVERARVEATRDGTVIATTDTDRMGRFALNIPAGNYTLLFARLGYRPDRREALSVAAGSTVTLTVRLVQQAFVINPVVASASRREEKALDAPASVTVVDTRAIAARPAATPIDHVSSVTGIVVANTGLTQAEVVTRGFNNVSSGALLVLTDNRYASVPSLRINVYNFIPLTNEDVERIEVVRGPGAALYGPNATDGVLHIITRSPFDAPGTTVSLAGGERSLLHAQFRHAGTIGDRLGIKLSGQYMRGNDWSYEDPREQANRAAAIAAGAAPDTLRIGRRDETVERLSGELRLDWRPNDGTAWTTSIGANDALGNLDLTPLGAAQVDNWRYYYLQSRLNHGRLFGQVFFNTSNSGSTYLLRTGDAITDRSQLLVAQIQHGSLLNPSVNLTYGIDLQRTVPRTDGTITGRNEEDDAINEVGAYLHSEVELFPNLRLVTAARVDYHNRLENPVVSPRVALVAQPGRDQTVRFTYNRAFSTPSTNNLFLDLFGDAISSPLLPIDIPIRLVGVPSTGFNYRRDCGGGLCMRSPYTPTDLGDENTYLPLDVTLLWPVLVDTLLGRGIDISEIQAPNAAQVGTVLMMLDMGSGRFVPVSGVADIPPIGPTIDDVLELGYKAVLWDRVSLGVDVYRVWKNDFIAAERVETPNVFFDQAMLTDYFEGFMPADTAADLAEIIAMVPAGTVTPQEARDPWDVLVTYRNFGKVGYWGADLELGAMLSRSLSVQGSYSWASRDLFPVVNAVGEPDTLPLNAPANKGTFSALYRDDVLGVNAEVRGRWVGAYPLSSGVYVGNVEAYSVVDATVGYRLPFAPAVTVTVNALNVLDNRHREFIGAPEIGRLVTGMVRAEF
jgi:iron complex outermembrane receptor protein